jgi:ABC-type nitrate/sulfonate/bicarbonate transport system substrate-binding protein
MAAIQSTRRTLLKGAAAAGLASAALPLTGRPARALEKVKIITTSGNLTWQEVLKQKGYLEALGVEAETLHVSDATKITGALLAGEADIAIATGFSQLFPAIQRGAKIKILAGGIILGQQTIYSKRPEIRTVADLAGKTIGVGSLGA